MNIKQNILNVTSPGFVPYNMLYGKLYTKIPKVAFSIRNLRTSDNLNSENINIYISSRKLTNLTFIHDTTFSTAYRILTLQVLLIDFDIPYHINCFYNQALNVNITSGTRIYLTNFNYTSKALLANYTTTTLNSLSSNNKVLIYINKLRLSYANAGSKLQYYLTYTITNTSFINFKLNYDAGLNITLCEISFILIDQSTIRNNYFYNFSSIVLNGNEAYFIPINIQQYQSMLIGLQNFGATSGACGLEFNYVQDLVNFRIIINQSIVNSSLTTATCGLSSYTISIFYLKTIPCPLNSSTPYYNTRDLKCYSLCPNYFYQNETVKQCQPCPFGCYSCINGNNSCTSCNNQDFRTLNSTSSKCQCISNYQSSSDSTNTKCVQSIQPSCDQNCKTCDTSLPNPTCKQCNINYILSNGNCFKCELNDHCTTFQVINSICQCSQCQTQPELYKQTISKTRCTLDTIKNCKYYMDINIDQCAECEAEYQPASQNTRCRLLIQNCAVYNPQNDIYCDICKQGYKPEQSKTQCLLDSIPHCAIYMNDDNNNCYQCQKNYYKLSKNKCIQTIQNCQTYNLQDQLCDHCDLNYTLLSSRTNCFIPFVQNCKSYYLQDSETVQCQQCLLGYLLFNETCEACDTQNGYIQSFQNSSKCFLKTSNCQQYNMNDICTKCKNGYQLFNNKCDTCVLGKTLISNCTKCDVENGYIESKYDTSFCFLEVKNCLSYDINNTCNICKTEYLLSNDKCDNCDTSNGYILSKYDSNICFLSIPNCQNYDINNICTKCNFGYELIDGRCDQCVIGKTLTSNCLQCDELNGYRKSNINKQNCVKQIKNCVSYNFDDTCKNCKVGFLLTNNSCNDCDAENNFVISVTLSDTCVCQNSFRISNINPLKCIQQIPFCQKYNQDTCQVCQTNYYKFSQLLCIKQILNCQKYNSTNYQCNNCLLGFKLSQNRLNCFKDNILHCLYYDNFDSKLCKKCQTNYSLTTSRQYCVLSTIVNCTQYNNVNSSKCSKCVEKTYLNDDYTQCRLCNITNCSVCLNSTSCYACNSGYQIYINQNQQNLCFTCNLKRCLKCNDNDYCQLCEKTSILINGTCKICKKPCLTCTQIQKCQTCSRPYFKIPDKNGKCFYPLISNCITYNLTNTSQCLSCADKYVLDSIKNICNRSCSSPCNSCTYINKTNIQCDKCDIGHFLNSKKVCQECQKGCNSCTSALKCQKAAMKFYITQTGTVGMCPSFCSQCNSYNKCLSLTQQYKNGYVLYINKEGFTSLAKCDIGCVYCSPYNIHQCLKCDIAYSLNSNKKCSLCQPSSSCMTCDPLNSSKCLTCYDNAFKSEDICINCQKNCLTCKSATQNNYCLSCKQGYYLSGTNCIRNCSLNCLMCNNSTNCEKCTNGYTLYDNLNSVICVSCTAFCRYCSKNQPSVCLQCGSGAYMLNNTCKLCPSNCKTCTQIGCTQCIKNYKLNEDLTCTINCNKPCSTCSKFNPNLCTSCMSGYTLNKNICLVQLSCNQNCTSCSQGYTLINGNCQKCTTQNCQTCDQSQTCTSCIDQYYLNYLTVQCIRCPPECKTCLTDQKCTSCSKGYTFISNQIIGLQNYIYPQQFKCYICQNNCATCIDQTKKCTSCVTNYQLFGWKCVKKQRYGFTVLLDTTIELFNTKYLNFMQELLGYMKHQNTDIILFQYIIKGSVQVKGTIDSSSTLLFDTEYNDLQKGLSTNEYIANIKIISSSVTQIKLSSQIMNDSNLGLILGIIIPIGIIIFILILVVIRKLILKNKDIHKEQKQNNNKQMENIGQSGKSINIMSNQTI